MAELLTIITPNADNRQAGDVCVVQEDGWNWSELERKLFVVVKVPMTVEEAEAKYLKTGVPDSQFEAITTAWDNFKNAKTDKEKKAARAVINGLQVNYADYHHRRYKLDVTKLPTQAIEIAQNTKQALVLAHPEAKAAARAEVESEIIKKNGRVSNLEKSMTTFELLHLYEETEGDVAKDRLMVASRKGRMTVIKPILDSIVAHPIIEKTKAELDDMTIDKTV